MALPHITNSKAGINKYEYVAKNLFEVYFTIPQALRDAGFADEALLSEHVLTVGGLGTLDGTPEAQRQKFKGTERTYIGNMLGQTHHEIEVKFTLNLRDAKDNYIYKLFKAWNKLNFDIATGAKSLKVDYCADWLQIVLHNRVGDVFRKITFKDVILTKMDGLPDFDYDANDALEMSVTFSTDWADEEDA